MKRESLFLYASEHFNATPQYLWSKYPDYAVLRHNNKDSWFGLIMNVSGEKLRLIESKKVDILNVKAKPEIVGSLRQMDGIYPAYHMNKEHWVSVRLDGPVSANEIYELLTESYFLTL
ncbi:MmcQ/YjbR family DNA-binding protein [Vibrio rumoiensis]|uniref:MmcQ/YjbR family DNA-binding protein n=1 Tax=Vibrio rumoiensis TaxID=76258 RepID=UPI003AA83684